MALVYCYMSIVCTEKSLSLITQRRQINKTYISFIDIPFKYKLFNYMYFFFERRVMLPTPNFDMLREMEIYSGCYVHQHMHTYICIARRATS